MRALATYILRGRMSAILVTAGMALTALILVPLSWPLMYLSGGSIVLVSLVQGPKEGLINLAGATLLVGVVTGVTLGQPLVAGAFAIIQWLPIWVLAMVLYQQRSLALTLMVLGLLGLLLVSMVYLFLDNPANWWNSYFSQQVIPAMKSHGMEFPDEGALLKQLELLSAMMTGMLVVSTLFGYALSLFVGRWWQSVLYRPGAFGEEFRSLRLGKMLSILVALIALLGVLGSGQIAEMSNNLLMIGILLFMFQGLAVAHSLYRGKSGQIWLIIMYAVMFVVFPYGIIFVALTGLVDNGLDMRGRFAR